MGKSKGGAELCQCVDPFICTMLPPGWADSWPPDLPYPWGCLSHQVTSQPLSSLESAQQPKLQEPASRGQQDLGNQAGCKTGLNCSELQSMGDPGEEADQLGPVFLPWELESGLGL